MTDDEEAVLAVELEASRHHGRLAGGEGMANGQQRVVSAVAVPYWKSNGRTRLGLLRRWHRSTAVAG